MIRAYALPAAGERGVVARAGYFTFLRRAIYRTDATVTLDFALARLTGVVDKLLIYPERMQRNLDRMGGLVHSQRVLLALTQGA
jgi:adenylosuccinate lyase